MGVLMEKIKAGAINKYERAGDKLAKLSKLTSGQIAEIDEKRENYLSKIPNMDDPAAIELSSRLIGSSSVEIQNSYLSQLKEVYLPEALDSVFDYKSRISYFDITKWVTDKNENSLEKLINVYEVLAERSCNIALIYHRTRSGCNVCLAAVNTSNNPDSATVDEDLKKIMSSVKGNFPGSSISELKDGPIRCLRDDKPYAVAIVSNVPSEKSEKFLSQTMEKLLDGIIPTDDKGKDEYTIVLLATPVLNIEERKNRLGELYTCLSPYASWQTNYTFTESDATNALANFGVNVGVSAGVQAGRNQGMNNSVGTTDNITETNTENSSETQTDSSSFTDSENVSDTHTTGSSDNLGGYAGVSGGIKPFGIGMDGHVGVNYSHGWNRSDAHTVGHTIGKTIGESTAKTIGRAVANSIGHAVTNTAGKFVGTSQGVNVGANLGANFARSSSVTATVGCNEGITQSFTNYNIKHLLENLENQMKRLEQSVALGMWDFAAYILSEDVNIANNVAHSYLALTQGEKSYLSKSAVNLWHCGGFGDLEAEKAKEIFKYIKTLRHPQFTIDNFLVETNPTFFLYPLRVNATTALSGKELAFSLNFPKKSISGLPVFECASFGRNITVYKESDETEKLKNAKKELEDYEYNIKMYQEEIDYFNAKLKYLENISIDELNEKKECNEKKISEIQNNQKQIENELDEFNKKLNELYTEKQKLEKQIKTAQDEVIKNNKEIQKLLKSKNKELELQDLIEDVFSNNKEICQLMSKVKEAEESYKKYYEANKNKYENLEKEHIFNNSEISRLAEEVLDFIAEIKDINKLEEYNRKKSTTEEKMKNEIEMKKTSSSDIETYQKKVEEQTINLGTIFHMNHEETLPVTLDSNSLTSHVFITGSTGSGKSNTVYQLLDEAISKNKKFLVIEPAKGEYKKVFTNKDGVIVYGTNPNFTTLLKINPFSFPENIHVLEHMDRLVEIFNVCWPMYAAMPAVLKEAIEKSYEDAGWDLTKSENPKGNNIYPTFADVAQNIKIIIDTSEYDNENKGAYKGSLLTRLKSLTNGLNGQIFTSTGIEDKKLFDENVIIDLSRVGSQETKSLLMGILVLKLQEYRMAKGGMNADLTHITVLEEAHNLLKRTSTEQSSESANLAGKSVEMLTNAIAEMRTYGEGFIIADQAPALLDMAVIRNTNTKIIMRLPDLNDRELVGKAANLNDDQITELAKLPCGVAAVYQNEWIEPVLCKVKKHEYDPNKYTPTPDSNENNVEEINKTRICIATLLSKGAKISLPDSMKELDLLNISFIAKEIAIEYLKNPPTEPRMTKLAPIMAALFPKAYEATKNTYVMNQDNPALWTNDIINGLQTHYYIDKLNMDEQVRRDVVQALITQYVFNEIHQEAKLEEWTKNHGF